jgi:competence protein ComEC
VEVSAVLWVVTIGVLAGQLVPVTPVVFAVGALAMAGAAWRWRWCIGGSVLFASAALGAVCLERVVAPPLPDDHVARLSLPLRGTLEGRVVAAPERRPGRTTLLVEASAFVTANGRRPVRGRVRLGVRGPIPKVRYGDAVRAPTTLRRPRNFVNPGSFDLVSHLARRGVQVTASVWEPERLERSSRPTQGVRGRLERWRARIGASIVRAVPDAAGPVLQALVVGDDGAIDDELRAAFTRAGVVHVLSVSGLHVGLVAVAAFGLVRWMLGRSSRLLLAVDATRVAAVMSLVPVGVYAALAGLEIATLRSALMVACSVLAALLGRRVDVLRTLALAALVLAVWWPGTPREISFQLSFVSVLAIVLGTRRVVPGPTSGWRARMAAAAVVSPAALAGTAPLTALHFQQVSIMSLLANPVAVPLFGSVVVVLGLAGACVEPLAPGIATMAFRGAGVLLRPGIAVVRALGRPAWAAFDVPTPSAVELVICYVGLGALWWWPRRGARELLLVTVLALGGDVAWWARARFAPGVLRVTMLDVGQGDAAVAELPDGRVLVVDAGGFPGSEFDTGAAVVLPFLAARKIAGVDALVMSHAHPDHSGGLASLLWRRPRAFWWTGHPGAGLEWLRLAGAMAASGVPVRVMSSGVPTDGMGEVLHPPSGWLPPSLNDASLVLRLGLGDVAILLTGDAESAAEARMLAGGTTLDAAGIKVPHHGSRTSSTTPFLDAVAARIAVMSVGADNRYHLPSPEVEGRYRARGVCLLRTDHCGAVTLETDGVTLRAWGMQPGCVCPPTPPP